MSRVDVVLKILHNSEAPLTLREIIHKLKDHPGRYNYDTVRGALTNCSSKKLADFIPIDINGRSDRNAWFITSKGKEFLLRPRKTVEVSS